MTRSNTGGRCACHPSPRRSDELPRLKVEHGLIFEGEPDQVRLRKLRGNVENFLHDHGVFAGSKLDGRLLNGGLWLRERLWQSRPAKLIKLGIQRTDLKNSYVM